MRDRIVVMLIGIGFVCSVVLGVAHTMVTRERDAARAQVVELRARVDELERALPDRSAEELAAKLKVLRARVDEQGQAILRLQGGRCP